MTLEWIRNSGLIRGSRVDDLTALPFHVQAVLCDLRPRFLPKRIVSRGYRAIARNGRVLVAAREPLGELVDRHVRARFQVWHRMILPGEPPEPYGILMRLEPIPFGTAKPEFVTLLVPPIEGGAELTIDVGGGLVWEFRKVAGCCT